MPRFKVSRAWTEIVLRIDVGRPAAEIVVGVADAQRAGLRKAEQEIGEIVTGVGERLAVGVEAAGEQSAEAERAARIGVGERVLLHLPVAEAEAEIVLALNHVSDRVGEVGGLAAVQRGRTIAQAAEVGEREIGRAVIEGRLIGSRDSELACDVRLVGEERRALADVAAEGERRRCC